MSKASRDTIIFALHKTFGNCKILNLIVLQFYIKILFPLLKTYLKNKYSDIVEIHYRNSITTPEYFNAFLSDLDISIIIKNKSDSLEIVRAYLRLKKIFIMLDYPEIYTEKEFLHLTKLKNEGLWHLIDFSLNFRKISWCTHSLELSQNELHNLKQLRAIDKSYFKILTKNSLNDKRIFTIEDFKVLKVFIPIDYDSKNVCYWSMFLETNKAGSIQLLMTTMQYSYMNSLMPGEVISSEIKDVISKEFLNNKIALEYFELYLSISSLRLAAAQNKDITRYVEWINFLEIKLGIQT